MKKLFLLIPALVFALVTNAAVIEITPTSPYDDHDNLRLALHYANAGDEIVLLADDNPYVETDDYLYFNKNITVRAAEGVHPVIQMRTYAQIKDGANVTIEGLKFDGSAQGSYDYYIRFYDASNTSLHLENCEFYSVKNYVIHGKKGSHTDECNINNCYFHNNVKNAVYFEASETEGVQTCDKLVFTNSTVANTDALTNYTSTIDIRPYGTSVTDAIKVIVDHCTFYNNPTINSDHSAIRPYNISDVTISNCIFAHGSSYERRATCCWGGSVRNCLTFNLTKDASKNGHGKYGGDMVLSGNFTADPLFNDLANNKYTFANNWVTMSISPACGAATDGTDLGDPRWYTNPVVPTSNFVAPYVFVGAKAVISGNIWYDEPNDYLYYNDKEVCGTAKWKIHATRACAVKATLNMTDGSNSGHIFRVELLDANGNHVDEVAESAESSYDGNIDLPNPLAIPAEGYYTVILHNDKSWSSAKINSITFAYVGGAVVTVPTEELEGVEAVLVNDGSLKVSKLENGNLKYGDNGSPLTEYVYWNINATKAGYMNVLLNVVAPDEGSASGHNFLVELYTDLSGAPIASTAEAADSYATGALPLPIINIPATGNYIIKLTNRKQWSSAILHGVEFAYAGGAVIEVPENELVGAEALLCKEDGGTLKMTHLENGDIKYNNNGYNLTEYALWNVHATEAGTMNVTLNISNSGHILTLELYDGSTLLCSANETDATQWDDGAIPLDEQLVFPAVGDYTIKLINKQQYSGGALHSITLTPATIELDEAADNSSVISENENKPRRIALKRSLAAGMFNTFCVPFAISAEEMARVFPGAQILEMEDATLEGGVLDLNFVDAASMTAGKPYLIKPAVAIVNPKFYGVTITATEPIDVNGGKAKFFGLFSPSTIPASEYNLFLGPDDTLYFPDSGDKFIKGIRGWFQVTDSPHLISHARIVQNGQVATSIDLVNGELTNGVVKTIENGQLVIIRDGVRYNVMGIVIEK